MEVRGRDLRPNFDEKQGTKSWISREEKVFFLNLENLSSGQSLENLYEGSNDRKCV